VRHDCAVPPAAGGALSVLWLAFRIIFDIHFHPHDASLRPGMVRRRAPRIGRQFDLGKFLYGQTTPVGSRTGFIQPADAVSAGLITENTPLIVLIPSQPMWTKCPPAPVIHRCDWLSSANGDPQTLVHFFQRLNWGHTAFSLPLQPDPRYLIENAASL
jgi:hypothetical protein